MRGEVVGLNTLKLIKKNTTGIALALSASDLLDVLHRFYPVTTPAAFTNASPNSVLKAEEMPAQPERSPAKSTVAVATGTVSFLGASGARIYVDGSFVGNIPSTIPLAAGLHKILVRDGKSADRQENLMVLAGGSQTCRVEFPLAQ